MRDIRLGLTIIAFALILGVSFPGFQVALRVVPVLWFAEIRLALAIPIVLLVQFLPPGPGTSLSWNDRAKASLLGATTLGFPIVLTLAAITRVAAGEASVLSNTIPLWLGAYAAFGVLYHRRGKLPDAYVTLGLLVGFAGISLMLWGSNFGGVYWAVAFLFANAFLTAINASLVSEWFKGPAKRQALTWEMIASAVVILPFAATLEPFPSVNLLSWPVGPTILFVGIAGTGLLFGLWYYILGDRSPERAGVFLYIGPAVSLILAALFLGESFNLAQAFGIAMVLGMAIFVEYESVAKEN